MARDGLSELQALAQRDAELRAESERLRAADAAVTALRAEAEAVGAFLEELPRRRGQLDAALAAAHAEVERRRRELAESEAALERAEHDEDRAAALHARERAADHLAVAVATADRVAAERAELERMAQEVPDRLERLRAEAERLGDAVPDVPAPTAEPAALVEWASRAHASLFVAEGAVDAQRDRLVREANELATSLLGEPTYGSTVAQVAARVEAAFRA